MRKPPTFPPTDMLVRFFASRTPLPIADVSTLAGFSRSWVAKKVRTELVTLTPDGRVPWDHAMDWVLRAWPLRTIEEALPADQRGLFPRLLQTVTVTWRIPQYIVDAMTHQAARENWSEETHGLTVEQYVSDRLHDIIESTAFNEFGREFYEAFYFPEWRMEHMREV
jgi:hypothetical protein